MPVPAAQQMQPRTGWHPSACPSSCQPCVLLSSVELLVDVDVESSGRYCLFLLRDQLAVKFLDNVSPDVDELPFDLGIPLDSWLLAFGHHHSLLRSHTTKITPSTAATVNVTVAIARRRSRHGRLMVTVPVQNVKCEQRNVTSLSSSFLP